jgi:hypothetical protein
LIAWITPGMRESQAKNKPRTSAIPIEKSSAELVGALGELMEQYPTAFLDSSRLPAPKKKMKTAIMDVWKRERSLRGQLTHAYMYLSHFQDGIGDVVLDCKIPAVRVGADGAPDPDSLRQQAREIVGSENLQKWIMWSKVSIAEAEILSQEWRAFESQAISDR